MKTESAKAANAIKAELKAAFPNVKFSVKSQNYSGGDSVDIYWTDGPTVEQVRAISGKYQYGKFDGMQDLYEYTNSRKDIPQAKYVSENRTISVEKEKQIAEKLNKMWGLNFEIDDKGQVINDRIVKEWDCYFIHKIHRESYGLSFC